MKQCTDPCALSSILVAAQSGDREAQARFATLLMTELKPITRRAFRVVPKADRDDALQNTFILLIQPSKFFDPGHPKANPIAYCFNAARSAANARKWKRVRYRTVDVEMNESHREPPSAVHRLKVAASSRAEARDDLRAAYALNPILFAVAAAVEFGDTAKVAGARFGMTASKVCRAMQGYAAQCREVLLVA